MLNLDHLQYDSRTRSHSVFLEIRGLRQHIRLWGDTQQPKQVVWLLHGWLDTSASFMRLVGFLPKDWLICAPDWRGYGLSAWQPVAQDTYWFADYLADFDQILKNRFFENLPTPHALIGHSMGGNIAAFYAGIFPDQIGKLAVLDSLNLPDMPPDQAPNRWREWFKNVDSNVSHALNQTSEEKNYGTFEDLAQRIKRYHPRVDVEQALEIAYGWGVWDDDKQFVTLRADPRHRQRGPIAYRHAEAIALWQQVRAEVLFLDASEGMLRQNETERETRRGFFAHATRHVMPECGHMLHFDQPEATAQHLMMFFK